MRVLRCTVANFRGFERTEIIPRRHCLLVGEPRGGRSDLLAALAKVFEIDGSRVDEFDFHNSNLSKDVEIVVVVGDLGETLEQRFLDQLEFWDPATTKLIDGADDPGALPADAASVLRKTSLMPTLPSSVTGCPLASRTKVAESCRDRS